MKKLPVEPERLLREAEAARRASYAPYSRFRVGAALLTVDGRVVRGCNVENSSLGLSICAERNAVWSAVAAGERQFVAVAVSAGRAHWASPCGACRQVLHEFAPGLWVIWRARSGRVVRRRLSALLPEPFDLHAARRPGGATRP
jgi:cytidine deaminase